MTIDWDFIGQLEGFRLSGYVPDPDGSQSGVTVASGVDLGQIGADALKPLPAALQAKLQPYLGLKGHTAQQRLALTPLTLSVAECEALDALLEDDDTRPLRAQWLKDSGMDFHALPNAVQTVLASVTFQYGTPWLRTPHFWHVAVSRNWPNLVADLKHFGDHYQPRHDREADYLSRWLATVPAA